VKDVIDDNEDQAEVKAIIPGCDSESDSAEVDDI
jgi:hypothetical protein